MAGRTDTTLAVMFADISGSTTLYEKLGDHAARGLVAKCLDLMFGKVEQYNGTVIKTIGDEVMCTFPSADQGLAAATDMHNGIADDLGGEAAEANLSIRIGLHYGPVILEGGDVFGDTVNLAARMAGRAKADQIIITRDTADALAPSWSKSVRHIDTMPVKGKSGEIAVFEVVWQPDEATQLATQFIRRAKPKPTGKLRLSFRGREVVLDAGHGSAMLGRSDTAAITIDTRKASRQHVRIECLRGRFILTDQSTNGTHVRMPTGEFLLRNGENLMLAGHGEISLGESFDEAEEVVTYDCTA